MIRQVSNPVVEVHDLTVSYQRKPVLWGVDFTLPAGSLCGIMGPNGAGKSTLIKACMDLIPANSGNVTLFGKELDQVRRRVSYVPQRESVDWDFPASVMDIVLMGRYNRLGIFQAPRKADRDAAMDSLMKVGMEAYSQRQIAQLSGGQQQRVFLARALAQDADLYFMDEPFAGVDMATEQTIIELLRTMSKQGKTIVVVHHDLQTAGHYFDWGLLINMRLVASGPIEEVMTKELLQETYGAKLNILTQVSEVVSKSAFPLREHK